MKLIPIVAGVALAFSAAAKDAGAEDPYLWLEDVTGEKALEWVETFNSGSLGYLQGLDTYEPLFDRNLEIYNSDERIAYPGQRADHVYNFWRDENNKKGLWRRVATADYLAGGEIAWEVILDVDALAEAEDENWVWKGSNCLRPEYTRCLLSLSRGGADATVVREFDVEKKAFVDGGFYLPEAKSALGWIDMDTVYVGTDFGEGTLTDSGYPMIAKRWERGAPLAEAETIFEGVKTDIWNSAYRMWDGDNSYDMVRQAPSFFTSRFYLLRDGKQILIDVPEDARPQGMLHGQLLVELKSSWEVGGKTYGQGALLSIDFESFLEGDRDFQVLVEPTETSSINGVLSTKTFLIVNHLDNVTNTLERFTLEDGRWVGEKIDAQDLGSISIVSASDASDTFFFTYEGFLSPDTLFAATKGGEQIKPIKSLPAFFDAEGMAVAQHFATSADGTRVPYFVVMPAGFEADGSTPTLLYGYGGFEVSLKPSYSATVGHSWLKRGGVYVVANIRGGGEFGPRWHQAALKENRQRAYDDFIAVAEDLVQRGITSPDRLGIRGGSNGGLLMGAMLTQRPDLFGAIVCQVPLLDMKRFNQLLAGASWMGEYGDPDTDDWSYISKYSPYQNLETGADYPKVFFTTSTRDDRVHPGHARKMVAKMTDMGYDLFYYENTEGGHAGASDNEQQAKVQALIYSYLWDQLQEGPAEQTAAP
ncbi:MAG: prolyl oligopeptidase family serine peptidase [Pseudomonadota bacterium]